MGIEVIIAGIVVLLVAVFGGAFMGSKLKEKNQRINELETEKNRVFNEAKDRERINEELDNIRRIPNSVERRAAVREALRTEIDRREHRHDSGGEE